MMAILLAGVGLLQQAQAMNPIVIKGNQMFDSVTKKRFFMRGITYDPIPFAWAGGGDCTAGDAVDEDASTDVLADDFTGNDWIDFNRDLEQIAEMNANTVRLYQIDPAKKHTKFMAKAESLGKRPKQRAPQTKGPGRARACAAPLPPSTLSRVGFRLLAHALSPNLNASACLLPTSHPSPLPTRAVRRGTDHGLGVGLPRRRARQPRLLQRRDRRLRQRRVHCTLQRQVGGEAILQVLEHAHVHGSKRAGPRRPRVPHRLRLHPLLQGVRRCEPSSACTCDTARNLIV